MMRTRSGQALLELILSTLWITALLGGTVALLQTEWQRTRCAYLVFEKAHARLTGSPEPPGTGWIEISSASSREVVATGVCKGQLREQVRLPRLEARSW